MTDADETLREMSEAEQQEMETAAYLSRMREVDPVEEAGRLARDISSLLHQMRDLADLTNVDAQLRVTLNRTINLLEQADATLTEGL